MEKFIAFVYRYRFKVALISSIFILDYALAGVFLNGIGYWLRQEPPVFTPYSKKSVKTKRVLSLAQYKEKILGTPFFPKSMQGEDSANGVDMASMAQPNIEFEKLGLILTGTVTGPRWFSRAYIRSTKAKEKKDKFGQAYKIGEKVMGWRLVWVTRKSATLKLNDKREKLYLYPPVEKSHKKGSARSAYAGGKVYTKVMSRGELNKKIFGNLNRVMKGLAVGPYFKGSKMEGYKIKRVRPSNVLYTLGARSGDIIKAVNGHKIDDIKKVLKLWERIKTEKNIKVDILRRGKMITYDFQIKD